MNLKKLVLFVMTFLLAGSAFGGDSRPSAKFAQPVFEFESVVEGTEVVHDYRIHNEGSGKLEIREVKTG